MKRSLRWQLIVNILCGITLLLGLGGTLVYFAISASLYGEFDRSLLQRTVLLGSMIEEDPSGIKIEWLEESSVPPGHQAGLDYFAVWTNDATQALAQSTDLEPGSLPRLDGSFDEPKLQAIQLPGGRPARCAGIQFMAGHGLRDDELDQLSLNAAAPVVQLAVARVDTVAPALAAIRRPLLGLWAGGVLLSGGVIWTMVRRGLRPLELLKEQLRALDEGAPDQRIVIPNQPAELAPVTQELNQLLERVEKALVRERTLTSNVAHELRTPIAGLLSTLEVTLSRLRSSEEYRESAEDCFEIAKRMSWLVNNLLSLTRIEVGNVPLQRDEVRIEEDLAQWWQPFASRAVQRGLSVEWQLEPGSTLETDPEFFRIVVSNLFDNAVSYAPERGTIRIEAKSDRVISVANDAGDLDTRVLKHAFEPFWRNAATSDGQVAHAGLGLNLCQKVITLLGGQITARIHEPEHLFVVRLEMP